MFIVGKDGKEYIPLMIGSVESREIGEYILCIETGEDPAVDNNGQLAIVRIHIKEIKGFRGSYSFPMPFNLLK